jgi:hypothetical protein
MAILHPQLKGITTQILLLNFKSLFLFAEVTFLNDVKQAYHYDILVKRN